MIESCGKSEQYDSEALSYGLSGNDKDMLFNALLAISYYPSHVNHFAKRVFELCRHSDVDVSAIAITLLRHIDSVPIEFINNIVEEILLKKPDGPLVESALLVYFTINTKEYISYKNDIYKIRDALNKEMRISYDLYMSE